MYPVSYGKQLLLLLGILEHGPQFGWPDSLAALLTEFIRAATAMVRSAF